MTLPTKTTLTTVQEQGIAAGDARICRIDALTVGDFIDVYDAYGQVDEISGPHGPLGTPPSTDWYSLRVVFEGDSISTTVGPKRGSETVVNWS